MSSKFTNNAGSFRDPANRVYEVESAQGDSKRILRGLNKDALANFRLLSDKVFFKKALNTGQIVDTQLLTENDADANAILSEGWAGVLEHEVIPFVTYPYEWTFSMLKDAALLQLRLIEVSLENGWTMKDATPYNVQWLASRPVFIDVPSFEPLIEGEPWVGYRQFCSMYLTPLMLQSHLGIDHQPLLRSFLDGIPPMEAAKFFTGTKRFKRGVMGHIIFPAKVENSIANRERDDAVAQKRKAPKQSKAMVIGLVQSLIRLVKKLTREIKHTDWSQYDKTHSYQHNEFEEKQNFVRKQAAITNWDQVWDIGCNTGTFSRILSEFCNQVISVDGDHNAVEQLYIAEKKNTASNILPLVMNLSNISPDQGWAGTERAAFDKRKKPDLILCLAIIHHMRMSANIPNVLFLKWLRSLDADIVIEFVNREDEMVIKLLTNKKEQYHDYNCEQFISETEQFFQIRDRAPLKGGKREIYFLSPK